MLLFYRSIVKKLTWPAIVSFCWLQLCLPNRSTSLTSYKCLSFIVSRPCNRCITMNKVDTCHDVQQKKRGRPKLRDKEAQITATTSLSPSTLSSMKSIHISLGSKSSFSMTKPANGNSDANQATTVITVGSLICLS